MFLIYNLLLTLLSPIWVPWMLIRSSRRAEKPNWKERTGDFDLPKSRKRRIWIHAVSVGEVMASLPILRELRKMLPSHEVVLSVTTSSGHQTAIEKAERLYDHLVYFPIDVARFQLAGMQRVRPDVVVIMETELWLNFLWAAKSFRARTLLINGRISDRSFPRSMRIRFFYKALLGDVDRCLMQTETDMTRIQALGARSAEVFGNCKFDEAVEGLDANPAKWREELGLVQDKPVVVVGSTRSEAEDKMVLEALRQYGLDKIQVIHAPRHTERAPEIVNLVGDVALRSKKQTGPYLVLDTYGELSQIYSVADVVIVGGGFDNLGGQNIIQPLALGKPVIHGPHMQNFRDAAAAAERAGATVVAKDAEEIFRCLRKILESEDIGEGMGRNASEFVQGHVGASRRYAEAIATEAKRAPSST